MQKTAHWDWKWCRHANKRAIDAPSVHALWLPWSYKTASVVLVFISKSIVFFTGPRIEHNPTTCVAQFCCCLPFLCMLSFWCFKRGLPVTLKFLINRISPFPLPHVQRWTQGYTQHWILSWDPQIAYSKIRINKNSAIYSREQKMGVIVLSDVKIYPVIMMTLNREHLIWKSASANAWNCTKSNDLVAHSLWTDQVNFSTSYTHC